MTEQDVTELNRKIADLELKIDNTSKSIDVITQNITEYLTNSVNMTSRFYDIFLNKTPMWIDMDMYNDQNELITVTVPNRAADMYETGQSAVTSVNEQVGAVVLRVDDIAGAQRTLVSGTNIKTINGNSLLASGNLSLQPTLVAGSNIKNTAGDVSIIGNGNLTVADTLGYVPVDKVGDTMTGDLAIRNDDIVKSGTPLTNESTSLKFNAINDDIIGKISTTYTVAGGVESSLQVYSKTSSSNPAEIKVGYDGGGNVITSAPTPPQADKSSQIATTEWIRNLFNIMYPIGSIYIGTTATCPMATAGIGTWTLVSKGRVLQGADASHAAGTTISPQLPQHSHSAASSETGAHTHSYGPGTSCCGADPASNLSTTNWCNGDHKWTSVASKTTGSNGKHSHTITVGNVNSSGNIFTGSATTVQPPAYAVNIWQRTA